MNLNLFGYKMLDSGQKGEVYATDLSDMVEHALANCPETLPGKAYPYLIGTKSERVKLDRRCRCAIYQELMELFDTYF